MSGLEDRCIQFHEAAMGTGKSKGPAKEIATLRRFLHKNQTQRFTDKATSRLFDTIQIYCTSSNAAPTSKDVQQQPHVVSLEDQEGLLEDALKMPFTVFTTKQKKTMLKWIEDIRGNHHSDKNYPEKSSAATANTTTQLTVIDLNGDTRRLSLMQEDTGETYEDVPLPPNELGDQIQQAFDTTQEAVDVEAVIHKNNGAITIVALCSTTNSD